jgi:hypothetical protein
MPTTLPPAAHMDKPKPYIPLAGGAADGWSTEDEATATVLCSSNSQVFVSVLQFILC